MVHTVVILEPNELPRYIANVRSLRAYKNNPYAIIDPRNLPTDVPLKYRKKGTKSKQISVLTKKANKDIIDQKIKDKQEVKKAVKI